MMNVADHADDFDVGFSDAGETQMFADGILVCEILIGEGFVDDDYAVRICGVFRGEGAAGEHRDAHRGEECVADFPEIRVVEFAGSVGAAVDVEGGVVVFTVEWKFGRGGDTFDAGKRGGARFEFLPEANTLGFIGVGGHVETELRSDDVRGLESGIDLGEQPKTFQQETGADEERERHRNFADDEDVAGAALRAGSGVSRASFERVGEGAAGGLESGDEAEDETGE